MTDKVTPTQADRNLYALIIRQLGLPEWAAKDAEQGVDDDDVTLYEIARHAAQAREEGMLIGARLGLEASARKVQNYANGAPSEKIRALSAADILKGGDV